MTPAAESRPVPYARFDDLSAGQAVVFDSPTSTELVANTPGDVVAVLKAVEDATIAGSWAAGFVSYEAAAGLDAALPVRRLTCNDDPSGELPLAWFCLFAPPRTTGALDFGTDTPLEYSSTRWRAGWDIAAYSRNVDAVREHIAAGDTYQCNLTVRLHSRLDGDLRGFYRDIALAQRGAYNAYIDTGRFVVASASPELFFEWNGDLLSARPMKGTIARGRRPDEDREHADRLANSLKDQAENVMIVDLVRNDIGKLAHFGSVEAPAIFELERFETLWQLTSTVTGRLRPTTTLVDIFQAMFPCGSVTGAPKRRTMALIAELEESRRGVYCGAVGFVAPLQVGLRARFNVAIRTAVVDRATRHAVYGAGGAVTWDSTADAEHAELLAKSAILGVRFEEFDLVETMGYRPSDGVHNLDRHLDRLAASAWYFGFFFDASRLDDALSEALAGATLPRRIRVTLSRSGAIDLQLSSTPPVLERPVLLAVDFDPVDSSSVWLYHKTTRRAAFEERAQRHLEADDVVL
ncbi:MAG: aminodeoxychorismate synthase component I, partial [Actinobacteria bacterium]|nr:aminodeoxychorismate synthase component I [Actinomycetota bacterium]